MEQKTFFWPKNEIPIQNQDVRFHLITVNSL